MLEAKSLNSHQGPVFAITRRPVGHRRSLQLMSDVESQYRGTQWPTYVSKVISKLRQIQQLKVT